MKQSRKTNLLLAALMILVMLLLFSNQEVLRQKPQAWTTPVPTVSSAEMTSNFATAISRYPTLTPFGPTPFATQPLPTPTSTLDPYACPFPLAQTTTEEAKPEKYTFFEPRIVYADPKSSFEIVNWLPDSQRVLLLRTFIENGYAQYQSIELFNPRTIKVQVYAKRDPLSYNPPLWMEALNAVIFPEFVYTFTRDAKGEVIKSSTTVRQLLWISHGDSNNVQKLEDVQFKPYISPHQRVFSSFIVKPDGSQIIYLKNNGENLYQLYSRVVSHSTLEKEQIIPYDTKWFENEDPTIYNITWRPRASQVFFYSYASSADRTALLDINTGRLCSLSFDGWVYFARWSPNGRYLAVITQKVSHLSFWSDLDLNVLDTVTGKLYKIDSAKIVPPNRRHAVSDFSWAPDNHHLAIIGEASSVGTSPPPTIGRLYLVDFLSGEVDNLFPSYQFYAGWWGASLAWSPDGSKIMAKCPTETEGRLCLVPVQTGGE